MQVIKTKVYTFNELSEDAKEKARAWFREGEDFSFHAESVIEDAKECAKIMGITIERVYYSGFYSQGDGACFEGTYSYKAGAIKAIKEYAPLDNELHKIAKDLQEAQKTQFYRIEAHIKHRGHYQHSGCTELDIYDREDQYREVKTEDDIKQALRDFMDWIYSQLEKEYEYQNSDSVVDDNIIANEYTFTENGERFG